MPRRNQYSMDSIQRTSTNPFKDYIESTPEKVLDFSQEQPHPEFFNILNEKPILTDFEKNTDTVVEITQDKNSESHISDDTEINQKSTHHKGRLPTSYTERQKFYKLDGKNPSEIGQCINFMCALLLGITGFVVFFMLIGLTFKSKIVSALIIVLSSIFLIFILICVTALIKEGAPKLID
ncbi:uncharacterized protein NPIL_167891 [Nephila pilipes]|uniref:Uncharacterized protein n=1 Tax=Nephila pilipes TaxID=299642 RepID=A0A8X6PSZ5_NEPPI|nr:uncharacterized protein NPIL_167891 [Nephila pilipes]